MRSTLRKFLRLASRDELKCEEAGTPPLPPPRPRPEIIHPLDLNKSAVQVLRGDGSLVPTKVTKQSIVGAPTYNALTCNTRRQLGVNVQHFKKTLHSPTSYVQKKIDKYISRTHKHLL